MERKTVKIIDHRPNENKIPFLLDYCNKVTNNGVTRKTLNLLVAPPKAGKSLGLCSFACDYVRQGYNVIYITLELAEERIGERIDSNLFNVDLKSVSTLDEDVFVGKIDVIKAKTHGELVIKEYSPKSAGAAQFRTYIDDLKTKRNFVPDVLIVDYLGITASSIYKAGSVNTYTYQQSVSEELRAIGVDYNIAVWSAVQTNRSGMDASDYGMSSIADSTGPLQTCDLALAIITTPELEEMHQIILKQLASRYGDMSYFNKFVLGRDKSRMKLYNVEESAQTIHQDVDSAKPTSDLSKPLLSGRNKRATSKPDTDWNFDD